MSIIGNMAGCYSPMGKTFIIEDENGNEITGVVTEQEQIFTATDNDVREGMVYASDNGVSTGTKNIPGYHTRYGYKFALPGSEVKISVPEYNYNNLFVTITTYDSSVDGSLSSTYVAIDGRMYVAGSATKISDITVDTVNEQINLGMTVTEKSVVRYLVTKEEF